MFCLKLVNKGLYQANIGSMRLKLQEMQETNPEPKEFRSKDDYQEVDRVLHHHGLPFLLEAIRIELISRHHDNRLAGYFSTKKTCKLLTWKYFWPSLQHNVKAYIKGCDVCLASKVVRHKLYNDLQSLPVPTHWWKDLLIDFVTGLPISIDWKRDSYNSILVIVDWLTKIVH